MKRHILIQELMGLLDIHEDVYRIVDLFIQKLFDVYKAETDLVTRYRLLHHVRVALMLRREEVPANKRMPQLCMALTELLADCESALDGGQDRFGRAALRAA